MMTIKTAATIKLTEKPTDKPIMSASLVATNKIKFYDNK